MAKVAGGTWTVYILRCADGSLYTGITTDMIRRCQQHNAGTASCYTRSRRPIRLVYHEAHANRSQASKREAAIKALSRRQKESMIRLAGCRCIASVSCAPGCEKSSLSSDHDSCLPPGSFAAGALWSGSLIHLKPAMDLGGNFSARFQKALDLLSKNNYFDGLKSDV